ncbi:MAG TPA: hypothetical protein VIL01_04250 [Thermomicrobiales bacterium]
MQNQLMLFEMVNAVNRERVMADAARRRMIEESLRLGGDSEESVSLVARVMERLGRIFLGDPAPRPEPASR